MFVRTVWNVKIDMNSRLFPVVKRSLSVSGRESVRDLASRDGELRVFLVAGEVSGDIIASRFMNSLKRLSPTPVRFAGVGGLMMSRQGLNSLFPMEDIAVMGIWELLPHLSLFKASRLALCTSGTVAVELQLARLPCVVAYRAHLLTEWFIRYKAKIPYISLPNIVLDSPIIPEALFEACTPSRLAPLLIDLMRDESLRWKQVSAAEKFLNLLDPLKRASGNPARSRNKLLEYTPSMIAASAVLNS
ncbi:UNVERIFIED_CONTAM: putative lipid-A-disaccharide synthase, mitochondrial [Sesamum radiatum]|uniref:lipid-A-disaccharide synthase n=1 Tax=Sesamum radiatum TaxID=300843 RepID=A0AAW2KBN7_SESRA